MAQGTRRRAARRSRSRSHSRDLRERRHPRRPGHDSPVLVPAAAGSASGRESHPTPSVNPWMGLRRGPVRLTSSLMGFAGAATIAGLVHALPAMFRSEPASGMAVHLTIGVALLALAAGVSVPRRLAVWILRLTWRKLTGRPAGDEYEPNQVGRSAAADRALHWMVLAVMAMGAGAAAALLPWSLRIGHFVYAFMTDRFLWSQGTEQVLQGLVIVLIVTPVFMLFGMIVSGLHHLGCPRGRWNLAATGWLLIGAGVGTWATGRIAPPGASGMVPLFAAAISAFAVALVSALWPAAGITNTIGGAEHDADGPIPTSFDRRPRLLRMGLVAVGGGAVCAASVTAALSEPMGDLAEPLIPAMLGLMGIGVLMGCRSPRGGARSMGGFGGVCALAGAAMCLMFAALRYVTIGGIPMILFGATAAVVLLGYGMAYGQQLLLFRAGDRSREGLVTLSRMLACAGLTTGLAAPLAIRGLGPPAALLTLALSLLALGGTLIIHEPDDSPSLRYARLSAIFASVGVMMLLACFMPR